MRATFEEVNMKTKAIFCKWKDTGDIIAFFPEIPADSRGGIMSYMHVGQHGAANYPHDGTEPASAEESEPLRRELESLGYRLR